LFPESGLELAALRLCNSEKFVNYTGDERADADFLEKFGMRSSLEYDAGRVERDRSAH
jgi:hypothetical protein